MAGTVSLHRHGNQSGGGWKGKSFRQAARWSKMAVKDRNGVNHGGWHNLSPQ